ncbi:Solute carrier family 2, facilitated glucose transporter member 8 [Penaeus vannamei]|uniref:Solute carrier family 2, facilitated glucose transporter member 8 n=1 Tax=Penaeus vannamei TaxID=6689 RepID=A0A423SE75_PENVA|nr:facilitated trehalose transporter Tret1-like [Penaeus vannamei]ROT62496.1 Solute carrier family 2, facilitated glucose transporter member 8 [Penaeus vannamei]
MTKNGIAKHIPDRNKEGIVNIAFTDDTLTTKPGTGDTLTVEVGKVSRRSSTVVVESVVVESVPAAKGGEETPAYGTQLLGMAVAALAYVGIGTISGFSGGMLPLLTESDDDLHLDKYRVGLFTSVINLGAAAGCIVGGFPHVMVGHRSYLLVALPLALAAWIILALSNDIWVLLSARTFLGFTMGVIVFTSSKYVAECAHDSVREKLVNALETSRQFGYLFVYAACCSDLSWRELALVCGCVSTILPFVGFLYVPSAPKWLATHGRVDHAYESLVFFRGPNYDSRRELNTILDKLSKTEGADNALYQLRQLKDPIILRFVVLFAFIHFASQFNGNVVTGAYAIYIFKAANVSIISPYMSMVVVGLARVLSTLFYLVEVERVGRKPLVIVPFFLAGTSLLVLGAFFYAQATGGAFGEQEWVPVTALSLFSFFSNIGFPVLNLTRGELLPPVARSTGGAILYATYYFGGFAASLSFSYIVSAIGMHGTFWIYCFINILVVVVDYMDLPETRGRSLEEIMEEQRLEGASPSHHDHAS